MEAETICTVTDAVSVKEENVEEKSEENEEIAEEGEENTEKYWVKLGKVSSNYLISINPQLATQNLRRVLLTHSSSQK